MGAVTGSRFFGSKRPRCRPRLTIKSATVTSASGDPTEAMGDRLRSLARRRAATPEVLLRAGLYSIRFISISVPFALGLVAQVGFFTHQMAFLSPTIGTVAAGWAVSLTAFADVVGRIVVGFIVDRYDRRIITVLNFIVQMLGMMVLAIATTPTLLYLGCALFGLGSGNLTSLPGLLVQQS
jgi:MFS family permease